MTEPVRVQVSPTIHIYTVEHLLQVMAAGNIKPADLLEQLESSIPVREAREFIETEEYKALSQYERNLAWKRLESEKAMALTVTINEFIAEQSSIEARKKYDQLLSTGDFKKIARREDDWSDNSNHWSNSNDFVYEYPAPEDPELSSTAVEIGLVK